MKQASQSTRKSKIAKQRAELCILISVTQNNNFRVLTDSNKAEWNNRTGMSTNKGGKRRRYCGLENGSQRNQERRSSVPDVACLLVLTKGCAVAVTCVD